MDTPKKTHFIVMDDTGPFPPMDRAAREKVMRWWSETVNPKVTRLHGRVGLSVHRGRFHAGPSMVGR